MSRSVSRLPAPDPRAQLRFGTRLEPIDAHELDEGGGKAAVMLAIRRQDPSVARRYYKLTRSG
jgi:hypothetical protein